MTLQKDKNSQAFLQVLNPIWGNAGNFQVSPVLSGSVPDTPPALSVCQVTLLLVEIGIFHRVARKAFQGPSHRWVRCSGKVYWSENEGLPPGGLALSGCGKSPRPGEHGCPPGRPGPRSEMPSPGALGAQHSLCYRLLCGCCGAAATRPVLWPALGALLLLGRENACYQDRPLLSVDYITSVLEDSSLSFKLTNLFSSSSQACAGPPT